jgi:hypothetical protein
MLTWRKLRHYFEAHPVTVVSSFPLGEIIRNPDVVGRIAKWYVELMGEMLTNAPRKAIKSQILVDFVAEWTDTQLPPLQIQAECWTLLTDKTRIHLRSASVRTYTFFTTGFPRFLSIRGARGLLALNQVLI